MKGNKAVLRKILKESNKKWIYSDEKSTLIEERWMF